MADRAQASTTNKHPTRASKILALVPKSGAGSDIDESDSSQDELIYARNAVLNSNFEDSNYSSDPPSLGSSYENLHLLSDDEVVCRINTIISSANALNANTSHQVSSPYSPDLNSPSTQAPVTSPIEHNNQIQQTEPQTNLATKNSLPVFDVPQFSPLAATCSQSIASPSTGTRSKKKTTVVVKKKLVPVKRLDTKWSCKKRFLGRAVIQDKIFPSAQQTKSPLEYFLNYFDKSLIQLIVHQTNLYHMQEKGTSLNVTTDEIRDFIAIQIMMGIVTMPAYTDYWSKKLRYNIIADIMPLKRFQQIRRYLHFADNLLDNGDRYYKVRPLLESVRKNCLKVEEETRFSIDEMMMPYKGTRAGSRKQYVKNKPRKWGFKIFVRAGVSGIVYDFLAYGGEDTFRYNEFTEDEVGMGLGAKVVLALAKTIKQKPGSVLYFDNFFTSLELINQLRNEYGIFSLGTIRSNRLRGAADKLPTDKNLKNKGRGSFAQVISNEAKIAIVKWFDNKCVTAASSYTDSQPVQEVMRYCKETKNRAPVSCPNIIKDYNGSMGGVDLADMLVALYRTEMRAHRWYIPLYSQILDICVNNAWLIYRRETGGANHMKAERF